MGVLDVIQFHPILQDVADDTVLPLGADNQANLENNRFCITNNRQWSEEQKHRIVEIDHQEKEKGKNFMKRIKRRWDLEFPVSKRTSQNLVENAKRFKKEGCGNMAEQEELMAEQTTPENNDKQLNRKKKKEEQTDFKGVIMNQVKNKEEQAGNNTEEAERIELPREELAEEDQDLKAMFITQLENFTHSSLLQIEPREKLPKARFNN